MRKENEEMTSLNNELFDEMYIEKLEKRLETDPFLLNGVWGDAPSVEVASCFCNPICELTCAVY